VKKIFLLTLLGCVKVDNNYPSLPTYNIIANLVSGNDTQYIYFDRVYSPYEEHGWGLEGAKISVYDKSTSYNFNFGIRIDSFYYYYSLFNPKPNDTLYLKVISPDLTDTFYANTYIPSNFQIVYPQPLETIDVPSNKLLIWTKSKGAWIYKINAYISPRDTNERQIPYLSNDTVSDIFSRTYLFKKSGLYKISIMAINEPLYYYYNTLMGNIEKAQGVFGGVFKNELDVYINTPYK
jgi:hypothetical protein